MTWVGVALIYLQFTPSSVCLILQKKWMSPWLLTYYYHIYIFWWLAYVRSFVQISPTHLSIFGCPGSCNRVWGIKVFTWMTTRSLCYAMLIPLIQNALRYPWVFWWKLFMGMATWEYLSQEPTAWPQAQSHHCQWTSWTPSQFMPKWGKI